jgi:uncharacterized protein (TIGR00255 family)
MNSMTGFGRAALSDRGLDLEVEIRSVNHRFLLVKQGLPEGLSRFEAEIEQAVRGALSRGSVSVAVSARAAGEDGPALPDLKTLKAAAKRLRDAAKELKLKGDLALADLLAVPGLWQDAQASGLEDHWPKIRKLLDQALAALAGAWTRSSASSTASRPARPP